MDNKLTHINEGGLHSQNPLGGVPMGGNNTVEENETKLNNFVYSDRIILDKNLINQFNLPQSLIGKSVAEATKFIDNKFKGRNDKISQSTKNLMLSKIGQAQESLKVPDESEMIDSSQEEFTEPNQLAFGGFEDSMIGQGFQEGATGAEKSAAIGAGINTLTGAIDLGKLAFGKPTQDTSGETASAEVNTGGMIGGSALKGASAGAALGPIGAGVGALVGGVAGLIGSKKAKRAAIENSNNFAFKQNKQFSDNYAMGGGLTSADRGSDKKPYPSVSTSDFAGGNRSYPIPTKADAIDALRLAGLHGRSDVKVKVYSKYPDLKHADGGKLEPVNYLTPQGVDLIPAINSANINDFKQPNITPINMEQPTFGQKLKLAGKDTLGAINNTFKNVDLGNLARYAPVAMNAYQLSQLKKPQADGLERLGNRYKPEYVDEAALQNIANQNVNNTVNAIQQSGASEGQIRSSILGSQLQRTKALSDAYSQAAAQNRAINDRAQTFNLGVDQVNLNQSNTETENYARDKGNYDTQKSRLLGQLGNDIGNIGKEEVYKDIAKNTTGYKWTGEYVKSPNGNIVTDPDTGKPMTKEKLEELQKSSSTNKKALGGYLMKNKY